MTKCKCKCNEHAVLNVGYVLNQDKLHYLLSSDLVPPTDLTAGKGNVCNCYEQASEISVLGLTPLSETKMALS